MGSGCGVRVQGAGCGVRGAGCGVRGAGREISLEGREADKADIWHLDVAPRKPATEESRQRKIKKASCGSFLHYFQTLFVD